MNLLMGVTAHVKNSWAHGVIGWAMGITMLVKVWPTNQDGCLGH